MKTSAPLATSTILGLDELVTYHSVVFVTLIFVENSYQICLDL
jgi:hypothetical protein